MMTIIIVFQGVASKCSNDGGIVVSVFSHTFKGVQTLKTVERIHCYTKASRILFLRSVQLHSHM